MDPFVIYFILCSELLMMMNDELFELFTHFLYVMGLYVCVLGWFSLVCVCVCVCVWMCGWVGLVEMLFLNDIFIYAGYTL